ncbi:MAG: PfkB family carbohydrate kinase, partial [Bacteroidota bacterium]
MVTFTPNRLQSIFERFSGKTIAVIGDLMLDRYYWGSVARLSPEAPVPVVEVESESVRLGGAANVANNIAALGGIPLLIGVVGKDDDGKLFRSILHKNGFPDEGLVEDSTRPTTVKTRVIAHHQHVVRV